MLRGTKRIAKSNSFDESKFIEFVKKNKDKYSVIDYDGEYLVSFWSVKPMVEDYKKTLIPVEKKPSKNLENKKK